MLLPIEKAKRLQYVKPSGMRALFDLSQKIDHPMKLISFGLGDLNIPTPDPILDKVKQALDKPETSRYSSNAGILELRTALSEKYASQYGLDYSPEDEIIVTCGCLEALFDIMMAFINPGDEILIQDPSFGYFASQASMANGKTVPVPLTSQFELDSEVFEEKITSKTKIAILNFPCNPTGSCMERSQLKEVVEIAADHKILVVSDESYEKLVYEGFTHTCLAEISNENVIVAGSFSKTYSMTGFRVGYALGPKELIAPVAQVHQYNTACAATAAQVAALAALQMDQEYVKQKIATLDERRKEMLRCFSSIPGFKIDYKPRGAFYIYPNISESGMSGEEFTQWAIENVGIVIVPGTDFGVTTPNCLRMCYGTVEREEIQEAAERIHHALEEREAG